MGYTNQTSNLGLPQWLGSDKPNWDIDLNAAFKKIDDNAGEVADDISELEGKHDSVIETIAAMQSEITDVQDVNIVQGERLTDLETDNIANKASIQKLNSDVSGLTNDVQSITDTELPSITNDIDEVESQVELNTQNITGLQDLTKYLPKINNTLIGVHPASQNVANHLFSNGTSTGSITFLSATIGSGNTLVRPSVPYVTNMWLAYSGTSYRCLLFNKEEFLNWLHGIMHSGSSVPIGSTKTLVGALCAGTSTLTMSLGESTFTYNGKEELVYDGVVQGVSVNLTRSSNTGAFGAISLDLYFTYDTYAVFNLQ